MAKKWINRKPKKVPKAPVKPCKLCGRKRLKPTLDGRCGRCRAKGIFSKEAREEFEKLRKKNLDAFEKELIEAKEIESKMIYSHDSEGLFTITLTNKSGVIWSATGTQFELEEKSDELRLVIRRL